VVERAEDKAPRVERLLVGSAYVVFGKQLAQDATVSPFLLARLGLVALDERAAVD